MFVKREIYELYKSQSVNLSNEKEKLLSDIENLKAQNDELQKEIENIKNLLGVYGKIIMRRFNYEIQFDSNTLNTNVNNYSFNPCKPDTWNNIDGETPMMINGEKIYSDFPEQMKWKDFFEYSNGVINFLNRHPENPMSEEQKEQIRFNLLLKIFQNFSASNIIIKMQKEKELNEQIQFQLANRYKLARQSKFNPYKPETWQYAEENKIVFVDGIPAFRKMTETNDKSGEERETIEYIFEPQWKKEIDLANKIDQNDISALEKAAAHRCEMVKLLNQNDSKPVIIIKDFPFTKAKLDLIPDWSCENLNKIADIMNYCRENKLKEYQVRQQLFDNHIAVDSDFFAELFFKESSKDMAKSEIDDLIVDYYHEVCIEMENPNEALDKSLYLADKPELKQKVLQSIAWRHEGEN